jgi:hypothetical protein
MHFSPAPSYFLSLMFKCVVLGDLVVIMLAIGHKIGGSNQAEGDGFLRALKIRSTTSFEGEIKPSDPCSNI